MKVVLNDGTELEFKTKEDLHKIMEKIPGDADLVKIQQGLEALIKLAKLLKGVSKSG